MIYDVRLAVVAHEARHLDALAAALKKGAASTRVGIPENGAGHETPLCAAWTCDDEGRLTLRWHPEATR